MLPILFTLFSLHHKMMEAESEPEKQGIYLAVHHVSKICPLACTVLTSFSQYTKCLHSCLFSKCNSKWIGLQRMVSDDLSVNWTYFFPKSFEWNHSIKSIMASPIPDVPVWRSL